MLSTLLGEGVKITNSAPSVQNILVAQRLENIYASMACDSDSSTFFKAPDI
jgi:hypothetical protein